MPLGAYWPSGPGYQMWSCNHQCITQELFLHVWVTFTCCCGTRYSSIEQKRYSFYVAMPTVNCLISLIINLTVWTLKIFDSMTFLVAFLGFRKSAAGLRQ